MSTPPAAFTADQLEDQVRNLLSDNVNYAGVAPDSIDPQTWSTQQIYDALNFAIKIYCMATNATYSEASAIVGSDGVAVIPTDYLELAQVYWPAAGTCGFGVFGPSGGD